MSVFRFEIDEVSVFRFCLSDGSGLVDRREFQTMVQVSCSFRDSRVIDEWWCARERELILSQLLSVQVSNS